MTNSLVKKIAIILTGMPGSGKGTYAPIIAQDLRCHILSVGNVLRRLAKTQENGEVAQLMNSGTLLPDAVVNRVVADELNDDKYLPCCVIDGYPRSLIQAQFLSTLYSDSLYCIHFDILPQTAIQRVLGRFSCADCDAVYNKFSNPPVNNVCACSSSRWVYRSDDTQETMENRIKQYHQSTEPILELYRHSERFYIVDSNKQAQLAALEVHDVVKKITTSIN
ncbi:adenylate kinase [Rickettsiales endosymbiont of Paramecium tredecaurelia]|uniref:nucleoside monophosphate kinase n=1 Tax=Candidatus Sarmatiella mevalonica TaxID=2770581 RepID=UPI001922905F|nr:nucleoside monophosphate kinase [Candidatus Sarmatiella mevalonica]MBL3284711.1 adenylate kinase [Candidatus Sarmatiella mevalonica]